MLSDEMRELLSAYVDGELRDADVARVENLTKRDPELRREVERFRKLGTRLCEWDEAEHGGAPSGALRRRALGRASAWLEATGASSRLAAIHRVLTHPAAIAAGLLAAVLGGLLAAPAGDDPAPAPPRTIVAERSALPRPALAGETSLSNVEIPSYPTETGVLREVYEKYVGGYVPLRDRWSDKAVELKEWMLADERRHERLALRRRVGNRTVAVRNAVVASLIGPYEAEAAPFESLAMLYHPQVDRDVPIFRALPADRGVAKDTDAAGEAGRVYWDLSNLKTRLRRVAPAGEVLTGLRDGSGRVRVVARSTDVRADGEMFGNVVWADATELPATSRKLEPLGLVLGPRTRRLVLAAEPRDDELRAAVRALAGDPGRKSLAGALRARMEKNERTVRRLMDALGSNRRATGFAVLSKGEVLGVELFATHALLRDLAPRLLHGYLLEAPGGIQLRAPDRDKVADVMEAATLVLDALPEQSIDVERDEAEDGDVSGVALRAPDGTWIGHGLAKGRQPIHLTLFGS